MESVKRRITESYWTEKLRGGVAVNTMPAASVSMCRAVITPQEAAYFNKLTGEKETAVFTVLLSVYSLLLQRYFGECAFLAANVAGYERDTMVLYAACPPGAATFREYLQLVKAEVQQVYKHAAIDEGGMPGLHVEKYTNYCLTCNTAAAAPYPLHLSVTRAAGGLEMALYYTDGFVDGPVAAQFLGSVKRCIINLEACIAQPVTAIPLVSGEEKNILLHVFNRPEAHTGDERTLPAVFEEQAAATPGNTALVFNESIMTYAELNTAANRFADFLKQTANIAAGNLVGIKLERSEQLLVVILGVLKAGAAYVPLDVAYPAERLAYMEQDSQCKLVVDDEMMSRFIAKQAMLHTANPPRVNTPDDLAYIIYTSGTTGKPKGVLITHRNATALIRWAHSEFEPSSFETVYAATSHCFDLSVFEMFYTLSTGKKIRLLHNATEIGRYLQQDKGILLNTVPSVIRALLEEGHALHNVTAINLAGEVFPADISRQLQRHHAIVRNLYGPSEDTTYSTCYRLSDKAYKTVPIGRPVTNTRAYILDESLQLLPPGVMGRLYISGEGLAKGYLNLPELTREKFVSHPYEPGAVMYDTGDLARWLPDGNIEFCGRRDHQVKLRGYRVELEEIEHAIRQFSANIGQVAAHLRTMHKDKALVACYTAKGPVNEAQLREHLARQLPAYMMPAHFVLLEALPLTSNGKVDRNALALLPLTGRSTNTYIAPRNADEEKLAAIWQEVLGIEGVGVTDHFFELGGHSLMISQVINRMYKTMGKGVTVKSFYANPTIAGLAKAMQDERFIPLSSASHQGPYPATPSQRRLWMLSQLEGGMQAYCIFGARQIKGPLHTENFKKAFSAVVARHEILSTCFRLDEQGELCQHVLPGQAASAEVLAVKDFSALPAPGEALSALVMEFGQRPFDLSKAPLVRAALVQLGREDHVFLLSAHHIVTDGWSLEILTAEILESYNRRQRGADPDLPALPLQFRDYALWLQELAQTPSFALSREYWLAQFREAVPVLQLPAARSRPLIKTFNGSQLRHTFSTDFTERLQLFAQEQQATVFMLLLSGVKILLSRYSNQYDITVGTPVAGREHPDLEDQVGLYLNTLAIRTLLDGNSTFLETLQKEKQQLLEAYAHQAFPFDSLVEALGLERDTSRSPLFDVMVVLHSQQQLNRFKDRGCNEQLSVTEYAISRNIAHFDLTFTFTEEAAHLSLEIAYSTDIYDADFAGRMFIHLENLFAQVLPSPRIQIKAIDIVTAEERQLLLQDYNSCKKTPGAARNVAEKFMQQAARSPHCTAVVFEGRELSYLELDRQSNAMARFLLQHHGIVPEDLIIVQLERSEWLIVTLLAILKAGAAYVPVAPDCPEGRLQHILQDTGAKVLVNAAMLQRFLQSEMLSAEPLHNSIPGHHLAYAIYTSGSTGVPKGVMVTHSNLLHFLAFYEAGVHRTALTANYVFDASVMEIFAAITGGSTLVIPHEETVMVPEAYAQFLYEHRISHCYMHPMHLEQVAGQLDRYEQVYLQRILTGAESIRKEALAWYCRNGVTVLNAYGPTEATIVASIYEVTDLECITTPNVPIGKPIPNYHIYLLNEDTQVLQPHGAVGELCISGPGVARGYLHREELTRAKFEASAFIAGERIYRTGDLARWLPDGNLEFMGRKDHQVKIRGNRVELGEIEHAIHSCQPGLKNVLATLREVNGEKALVAYYVAPGPVDKTALRNSLQEKLPAYMVPAYYVALAEMPLTVNGKIDRERLPGIAGTDVIRKAFVAPRDAVEQKVTDIWKALLHQPQVGVTDDFFELGGHSLLLAKLINEYRRCFNAALSLGALYASPTPEQHARLLAAVEKTAYSEIAKAPEQALYELSPAQLRYWLLYKIQGKSREFNIYSTFPLPADLDTAVFNNAFNALLERHEILRTVFVMQEGVPGQQILAHKPVRIPFFAREEEAQETVFGWEFDLEAYPLYRVGLVKKHNGFTLFFNMHHIISDGWTMGLIARDLMAIYRGKINGTAPGIPALPVSYKDYARWQNQQLQLAALDRQGRFWKTALSGSLPYLQLPLDYAGKAERAGTSASYTVGIKEPLQQQIRLLSARNSTSVFALFAAAFKVLLHRLTGEKDIIIGIPAANRNHYQLKDVAGCFLNTLMLRDQLDAGASFDHLLQQVNNTLMQALENQQYPFERLLEELNIQKDGHRFPISPVFLNMLDFEAHTAEQIDTFDAVHGTLAAPPKFDLECYIKTFANGYTIQCVYDNELFRKESIRYWIDEYLSILGQVTAHAAQPLGLLNIFATPAEAEEDPQPVNDFAHFEPEALQQGIARRFERQVRLYPGKTAVYCNSRSLTYRQLNNCANHLARNILQATGKKTQRVALLLEHDETCVAGMLGVLKAGLSYVPVDADSPPGRIKYIVEDAACSIMVCAAATLDKARQLQQALPGLQLVTVVASPDMAELPDLQHYIDPLAEAYVLYTSGSTGAPKGVIQNQRNVLHYIRVYTNNAHISARDNLSVFSTYTFDAAVKDVYGALLNGAVLSIYNIREEGLENLAAWINRRQLSIIHMVPTVYRHFMKALPAQEKLETVRLVDLGGEPCYKQDLAYFKEHFVKGALLVNDYGPTESTIVAQKFLSHHTQLTRNSIPLGKPVTGTEVFLLDEHNRKCGIYQEGEIAFASSYLSLGYLNRQELTDRAFVTDAPHLGHRVYRSGDIGRMLPNGEIEFLQRKDTQVKLNGLRIELSEIEHCLQGLAGIKEAVVLLQAVNGQQHLAAYISTEAGLDTGKITAQLRERLPRYMIPSVYIPVAEFPLTRTGKIDRAALPAPAPDDFKTAKYTLPENEVERMLAGIWAEALRQDTGSIGVKDSFFELGGNSLLAVKLVNRVNRETGVAIKVKDVFTHTSIREMAQLISATQPAAPLLIPPAPAAADYVLSTHQRRLWLTCQQPGNAIAYNIPGALLLEGALNLANLQTAYQLLTARHESLRTVFINEEVLPRQQVTAAGSADFEIQEMDHMPDAAQLNQLVKQESSLPFVLYGQPLVRARVIAFPGNRFLLLVVMHHIISDGWSMEIFIREWISLYAGLEQGQEPSLPPLPIQYKDYAVWQQEYMQGAAYEKVIRYWRQRLSGELPVLHLPFARPRTVDTGMGGEVFHFTVDDQLYASLQELAVAQQSTLFSVLFTAFNVLLYHISHQQDIILGTSVAGRRHESLESIIGFFVNTLAIKTSIASGEDFTRLLQRTGEQLLNDFEHQDMPFEELVTHLDYERIPGVNPVFQARFVLNSAREDDFSGLEELGIGVSAIGLREVSSKFDLSLVMRPGRHLAGIIEYRSQLFKAESMSLLSAGYVQLLEAVVKQPHQAVGQLDTFNAAYQQHLDSAKKAAKDSLLKKLQTLPKK